MGDDDHSVFGFTIFQNLVLFQISVCSIKMSQRFTVDGEINRECFRFNATGTQFSLRLLPPPTDSNPITHFLDSMSDLFEYALRNCSESHMVGVRLVTKLI